MRVRFGMPSPSMVVSLLALSIAMGGTSYAAVRIGSAQINDNSILSRDVRNNTLTTSDVKNDTLTGRDIREGTLAKVRTAGKVDNFVTFNVGMNRGDPRRKLAKVGPVTLYGACNDDAGNAHGFVTAETTAPHTYTYDDHDLNPGEVAAIQDYSAAPSAGDDSNFSSIEPMFFSGQAGGSFDYDGEAAAIIIGGPGAECRFVGSLPLIPAG